MKKLLPIMLLLALCLCVVAHAGAEKVLQTYMKNDTPTLNGHNSVETTLDTPIGYCGATLYRAVADETRLNYKYIGEIAADLPEKVNETTWRIALRPEAKWANGEAINADTVMYSFKMLLDPQLTNQMADFLSDYSITIKNAKEYSKQTADAPIAWEDVGIKKIDDYTMRVVATEVSAPMIYQLQITPDMLALTPCSGSYIMTDNTTGKVKAFVSYPGYDANKINNVSYYSSLINNASAPLYNHVTQQLLAPGSTFKPVSAAAGLEEGVITKDTYIYDNTTFTKVQPPANDWTTASHGNINVAQAIEYSCNYFFYELGYRLSINDNNKYDADLGLSRLQKYAKAFGLDETSGLELTESQPHISDEDPVRSAIGQSKHEYTAAELARYVTAVATKGTLYNLTLIDHTSDHDGSNVQENKAKVERTIDLQDSTWEQLHYGMYMVCNESYYAAKMSGYGVTIAGKSGTAQESEKKSTHSLFVGFAPYDDPQVTAVIIIPNGFGSSTVLDLYTDLMCTYFNIPVDRNDDGEEDYPDDPAKRTANIPESSIASD